MGKYSEMILGDEPETPRTAESVQAEYESLIKKHGKDGANQMIFQKHPDLLENDVKPKKWSKVILGEDEETPQVMDEYTPTEEISTITGKPKMQWTPDATDQAGIGALMKSGFVDDPKTKMKIFAASRFPDMPASEREAKYKEIDGNIVFIGDDGRYHREVHTDLLSKLRGGASESVAALPSGILGAAGATLGPGMAAVGAAGGEGIRRNIGSAVFDEPQNTVENVIGMGSQAALAGVSELGGRALTGGINLKRMGGPLEKVVKGDIRKGTIGQAEQAMADEIKSLSEKHGIDLNPGQMFDKESLLNKWSYLRKHPQTSDAIQEFEKKQGEQVSGAMKAFMNKLSHEKDPYVSGSELRAAAQGVIDDTIAKRTNTVSPLYQKAFSDSPGVDISKPMADIDSLIEKIPPNLPAKNVIDKVKSFFLDENGAPLTDLEKINWSKKEVDKYLKNINDPDILSTSKETMGMIQEMKKRILSEVDNQSPEYAKARKAYELLTPEVKQLQDSTIGMLSRIKNDNQLVGAASTIFNGKSPAVVESVKGYLASKNPELWDQTVAAHMRNTWNSLTETQGGDLVNAAGKMRSKLFGSADDRAMMKAALSPEQYENMEGLMTVLQRAAKGKAAQSMTQPFAAIDRELSGNAGELLKGAVGMAESPAKTSVGWVMKKWDDIIQSGNQVALLEAMTDPKATEHIKRMKMLSPNTEKGIRSASVFLAWLGERVYKSGALSQQGQEVLPQQGNPLPQGMIQ